MLKEPDLGTPAPDRGRAPAPGDRRAHRSTARPITVAEGTSVLRAAALAGVDDPQVVRHRQPRAVRLVPPVPGRDRRAQGHAGVVHHPGGAGHVRHHPVAQARAAAPRGDGAVHLRPPARLPDVRRQRRLRAAGHGRRGRPARRALRLRRREPPRAGARTRPTRTSRSTRRSASCARAACAPARRSRARSRSRSRGAASTRGSPPAPAGRSSSPSACRAAPACRPAPRPRSPRTRSSSSASRAARCITTCAYCGVGCSFRAEMQGETGRAHGAVQGRRRQRRALVRQGPVRLGLRRPRRPRCSTR